MRSKVYDEWRSRLLHIPSERDQAVAAILRARSQRTIDPSESASSAPSSVQPANLQSTGPDSSTEASSSTRNEPGERAAEKKQDSVEWKDIEIAFLSDKRIQIFIKGKVHESFNYAEFGFMDMRSENPNEAWATFLRFAQNSGEIWNEKSAGTQWPKLEKRIQEIRALLRKHFSISVDPIPYDKGRYQALFKVRLAKSFES